MKILYFGNPMSIHDVKWMSYFSHRHESALVMQADHARAISAADRQHFSRAHNIPILATLEDFSLTRPLRTWRQCRKLKKVIREFQPDVMHILFAEPNALWSFCRARGKAPSWMVTTRGTDILVTIPRFRQRSDLQGRLVHWLYRLAFARLDHVVGTSSAQLANVRQDLEFTGPCTVIRTGTDVDQVRESRPHLLPAALRDRPYIFFPRLMTPLYGQEISLDIIAALPAEVRQRYSMVFVDSDKGDPAYVEKIRRRMAALPDVDFHFLNREEPPVVWELYKAAQLTVMTPRSDGSPVSAMESLLCGTPVVAPPLAYDQELREEMLISDTWEVANFVQQVERGLARRVELDPQSPCYQFCDRAFQMRRLEGIYEAMAVSKTPR